MSYRVDSDVFTPYGNFIPLQCNEKQRDAKIKTSKDVAVDSESLSRAEWTQRIWRKLDEHLPVHVFGKCGNFTCPAPPDENFSTEEGAKRLWKYKFFLTFESSLCEDYITEKY